MRRNKQQVKEELFARYERHLQQERRARARLLKGGLALVLCLCLVLPVGFYLTKAPDVHEAVSTASAPLSSTTPAEGSNIPAEGSTTPGDGSTSPVDGSTSPVDGSTSYVDGSTLPSEGGIPLGNGSTSPSAGMTFTPIEGYDLMVNIKPMAVSKRNADDAFVSGQLQFALQFLQKACEEKQTEGALVSPLSAELCLAMVANGASGVTLSEMEDVLCNGMSIDALNEYLHTYVSDLPSTEDAMLKLNNAIWFDNSVFKVNPDFLQANADYYGAEAYQAVFDDKLCGEINDWVKDRTDGMIEKLFDQLDGVMALVNTVLFDAAWDTAYADANIHEDRIFHSLTGEDRTVTMLSSQEKVYLKDSNMATGFVKPYAGGRYAFAALLPNEGVDVLDYVASLEADGLQRVLKQASNSADDVTVNVNLPEFSFNCKNDMTNMLKEMGMPTAFVETGDFLKMGNCSFGNVGLDSVVQNTAIEVSRNGTKAAAATGVIMDSEAVHRTYDVTLDRPFVYMILDTQTMLPLFIGVQTDIQA